MENNKSYDFPVELYLQGYWFSSTKGVRMMRTFKYTLHPTPEQVILLEGILNACCGVYNIAIGERQRLWKEEKKYASKFDQ